MIFSYRWLKEYLSNLPPAEKLAEILNLYSFETEIKKEKNDFLLEVDILPNRYDAASYFGLAKEIFLAFPKSKLKIDFQKLKQPLKKIKTGKPKVKIEIEDFNLTPRYIGVLVEGIENKKSPKWLEERLALYGINSYNLIVDLTNYVMLETGQPLHAFDASKIEDKKGKIEIFVRRAKRNEEIVTLEEEKYQLGKEVLVITSKKGPLAIAGIKGGKLAEVDFNTKKVLFEAASFDRRSIYLASKNLKLESQASIRFSHQLSPFLPLIGMRRLLELLLKFEPKAKIVEVYDLFKKPPRRIIPFHFEKYESYLGEKVLPSQVKKIFEKLGAKLIKESKEKILIEPPEERADLNLEIDLFEEVARLIGYEKLKEKPPLALIFPKREKDEVVFEEKIKDIFVSLGFDEVYNYSMKRKTDWKLEEEIKILNPTSKEFEYLRSNLVFGFLKNVALNFKFLSEVKAFEIGKIFYQKGKRFFEEKHFGAVLARKKEKDPNQLFYEMKGVLESFLEKNGLDRDDYYLREPKSLKLKSIQEIFHPFKFGEIVDLKGNLLGFIGEIKEKVLEEFEIPLKEKPRVCIFELCFDKILKLVLGEREFQPLSKYPAVIRDISLLVDFEVKVDDVMKVIYDASPRYVEDVDLFDIYLGENLPEGKKSLAFHIIFQAKDRTLTEEEVEKEFEKIKQALKEKLKAEIRS